MKITVEFEIDENELGEYLVCDDPETHPLFGYGLVVRNKLAEMLGYSREVREELEKKAKETIEKPDAVYYVRRLIELTQEWAIERLKEKYPEIYLEWKLRRR